MAISAASNSRKTTACTLRIDQNLYWHRAVSLRQRGSCHVQPDTWSRSTIGVPS